jgi:multiple sugar transport system permease protein
VHAATWVVLKYALVVIPFLVVVPLLMAFSLNRTFRGIGIFRAGVYFPHIVSMVVVATMFIYIYRSDGIINQVLWRLFGLFGAEFQPISFLKTSNWALLAVIFVTVFKSSGYYAILYLAGLQNVPTELIEAAQIDGANWVQRLWYVILPQIRPMATLVVIIATIGSLKLFGEVFVMTNGGPGLATGVRISGDCRWRRGVPDLLADHATIDAANAGLCCHDSLCRHMGRLSPPTHLFDQRRVLSNHTGNSDAELGLLW